MTELNRREFLKASTAGGALLLSIHLPVLANESVTGGNQWSVYVTVNRDNSVVFSSPVMDMGQHMKTTGPMMLAEEMDLDWSLITFTDNCPTYLTRDSEGVIEYAASNMETGGSEAVRNNWDFMRRSGAIARRMLLEEAADRWQTQATVLQTRPSFVKNPVTGQSFSYGELAERAALRRIDSDKLTLKSKSQYQIMGKPTKTVDLLDIVTGKPIYGIDETYPNMLHAVILRAPKFGSDLKELDCRNTLACSGVVRTVEIEKQIDKLSATQEKQVVSSGVAVVADSLWAAMRGRDLLQVSWSTPERYLTQDSEEQLGIFRELVAGDESAVVRRDDGNVEQALQDAQVVLDKTYQVPLFAHACMEPFSCIADIREDSATIVIGHQSPRSVAQVVEKQVGIDALKVEVIGKRMGGGFGRRSEQDYLREAIVIAKEAGVPVKVTWTQEDAMEHDFFAPAYVMRIRASLDKLGSVSGWHHRQAQTRGRANSDCFPANVVPNYRVETFMYQSMIPVGPWRGPGHSQWAFAAESMIDELSFAANVDPVSFRLSLMEPHREYNYESWGATVIDSGRMAACYKKAAEMANWWDKRSSGTGVGIAGHFTFGSYCAFVVEVKVSEKNQLSIERAWGAIDCGFAINPNHIANQMEGGFIDGLNAAMFNRPIVAKGQVITTNFDSLRWMRLAEAPKRIEVSILENDYPPSGVGEPPTAPAAAALVNAIFAATGNRIRQLPVSDHYEILG